jgi:oligoribonuclease NrnB/cAMP/cGMP phosphodiesterase (DHH superfamily)
MESAFVISHGEDIDGIGSASLLKLRYHIDSRDLFFINHSLDDFESAVRRITPRLGAGSVVFLTDLSPSQNLIAPASRFVRAVNSRGGGVVWLDHHYWSDRAIREIALRCETAIIGENKCACATDITKRYTRLTGDFVERFVSLVHCIDLYLGFDSQPNPAWSRSAAKIYSMSINYLSGGGPFDAKQGRLRRVADLVSSGKFFDGRMRAAARSYERVNRARIRALVGNMGVIQGRMAVGFSREVDSSDACHAMIDRSGADISVLVKTDSRTVSIRSMKSDIAVLATSLGGGGHPHAAGFEVPRAYDLARASGRERFIECLVRRSRKLGLLE